MKKKSQIQMGETVGILFIFFILLVFGFVFYMNVMKSSSKVEMEENIQLKVIGIAQRASFLPELQCSDENVRVEGCIDLYKLESVSNNIASNRIYYYDVFESSVIWVEKIFPEDPVWGEDCDGKLCKYLYKYEASIDESDYKNKLSTFIPVSLYNPEDKNYGFGILVVEVYRK